MRTVTRVVELGRALRERSGLRTRQPLRALHVRTSDPDGLRLLACDFATELILGELNIKTLGSLAADGGTLCRLKAKPNFRTLGKRLGGLMKPAAAVIEHMSPEAIARLRAGGSVEILVEAEPVLLGPEDVIVAVETDAPFEVETDGTYVVYFDSELDEELVVEGLAREVVNRVNGLRKERGLAVEDRVRLEVWAGREGLLRDALAAHESLIRNETLAVQLTVGDLESRDPRSAEGTEFDLGEGGRFRVRLARA